MWTSRNQLLAVRSALGRQHDGGDEVVVLDIEGGGGRPMSAKLKGKTLADHCQSYMPAFAAIMLFTAEDR